MTLRKSSLMAMIGILLFITSVIIKMSISWYTVGYNLTLFSIIDFISRLLIIVYYINLFKYFRKIEEHTLKNMTLVFSILMIMKIALFAGYGLLSLFFRIPRYFSVVSYFSNFTIVVNMILFLMIMMNKEMTVVSPWMVFVGDIISVFNIIAIMTFHNLFTQINAHLIVLVPSVFLVLHAILLAMYFWRNYKYGPEYSFVE